MRVSGIWMAALLLAAASPPCGQTCGRLPTVGSIEPQSGREGDPTGARGSSLEPDNMAAAEQTAGLVKFKIPAGVTAGRLAPMALTAGPGASLSRSR